MKKNNLLFFLCLFFCYFNIPYYIVAQDIINISFNREIIGCRAEAKFGAGCEVKNCTQNTSCIFGFVKIDCKCDNMVKNINFDFSPSMKHKTLLFADFIEKQLEVKNKLLIKNKILHLAKLNSYQSYFLKANEIERLLLALPVSEQSKIHRFPKSLR